MKKFRFYIICNIKLQTYNYAWEFIYNGVIIKVRTASSLVTGLFLFIFFYLSLCFFFLLSQLFFFPSFPARFLFFFLYSFPTFLALFIEAARSKLFVFVHTLYRSNDHFVIVSIVSRLVFFPLYFSDFQIASIFISELESTKSLGDLYWSQFYLKENRSGCNIDQY